MRLIIGLALLQFSLMTISQAAESAYPRTEVGTIEIKTLPAGRLIEHQAAKGSYFDDSNNLFGPLFRYIQGHQISMTTPVEARIEPATMRFWISEKQRQKADGDEGPVQVMDIPARTVAAIGGSGAYSNENFNQARDQLMAWLAERDDVEPAGDPFAAYWNGPFTPWFMKKFEVLIEIQPTNPD